MRKVLQVVGVVALVAWTGVGLAAWVMTKDGLVVTIADGADAARSADDPIALLRDQVVTLSDDVAGVGKAVTANLQILQAGLADDAAARAAVVDEQLAELRAAAPRDELGGLTRAVDELGRRIAVLEQRLGARPPAAGQQAASPLPAEPLRAEPPTTHAGTDPVAVDHAVTVAPAPPAPAAESRPGREAPATAPQKRRSFLAFELPSRSFRFDTEQAWSLIPSLSRVGFDGKSTLHDFTGVTSKVEGRVDVDLSRPGSLKARIVVDAATLDTGLADRNAAMYEHLDTPKHAQIEFVAESFRSEAIDAEHNKVTGTVTGKMTIRGVTRELSMPVEVEVDDAMRLAIRGETKLKLTDYEVPVPSKLGLISMYDEVNVWIALRARLGSKP